MSAPRVLFVADGDGRIGHGHQARCAALAAACVAAGLDAVLACRDLPGNGCRLWQAFPVLRLPATTAPAAALAQAIALAAPRVVVVDHYALGADELRAVAGELPLVVIDDRADRPLRAELVVNAAPGLRPIDYPGSPALLGPGHALLRPGFPPSGPERRDPGLVVVACGAADPRGLAGTIAAGLLAEPRLRVVVLGGSGGGGSAAALASLAAAHPGRLEIRSGLPAAEVAALFVGAGAGVVAASTVALEALTCRLPIVAVASEANQAHLARGLRAAGIPVVDEGGVAGAAALLAAARAPELGFDGLGAGRVAARIAELARAPRSLLRPALPEDARLLLAWANDPEVRRASFASAPIGWDEHRAWFDARLADPEARIWIAHADGSALGVVRLQREGDAATVSITVAPEQRGAGVGRRMLDAVAAWAAAVGFCRRLVAWIALDNGPSIRLFERCAFVRVAEGDRGGRPAIRCEREIP